MRTDLMTEEEQRLNYKSPRFWGKVMKEVGKLKCEKHPKYKGKKKPKNPCEVCLNIYLLLQKPRQLPMPTKVYKDKSKYTRKDKHKGNKDE